MAYKNQFVRPCILTRGNAINWMEPSVDIGHGAIEERKTSS